MGLFKQLRSVLLSALQPQQRHIGRLVASSVFARGFAQRGRVCRDVQDVIHHLEGQTHRRAVALQSSTGHGLHPCTGRAHHHAAFEQRTGFEAVHLAQLVFGE